MTQKRLVVVGNPIRNGAGIVLVEIRDEIVVLVPTRKNQVVIQLAETRPIREAVLVIVILDKFVEIAL